MAPHATYDDVRQQLGVTYDAGTEARVTSTLIPRAERRLRDLTGCDFYDTLDPLSDASQDWLLGVAILVDHELHQESQAIRDARGSPFQTERLDGPAGSYQYTLKKAAPGTSDDPFDALPPALHAIVLANDCRGIADYSTMLVVGPTRAAKAILAALEVSEGIPDEP